ncbi:FHA domain-containing protein [bacterium]|nr:FHA domain-containing protein [bacterium]
MIRNCLTAKRKTKESKIPTGKFKNTSLPNARLIVSEAQEKAREFFITPRKEFWIGRDDDNQLILENETISRKHAKIRPGEKGYVLYDMLSRNGTYVNRKKIKGYVLGNGDLISIGSYTLIFNEEGQELKRAVAVDSVHKDKIYYKDKREYIRLPVDTEIYIKICDVLDFAFERIKGKLKDIGEGGVCFRTSLAIPELAVIKLDIVLPEDKINITATGKVVWRKYVRVERCYELGVQFLEIKDEYRRHIIEHINRSIHNYTRI